MLNLNLSEDTSLFELDLPTAHSFAEVLLLEQKHLGKIISGIPMGKQTRYCLQRVADPTIFVCVNRGRTQLNRWHEDGSSEELAPQDWQASALIIQHILEENHATMNIDGQYYPLTEGTAAEFRRAADLH